MSDDTDIKVLARFEGLSFEEATLAFSQRQNLPLMGFCGPNYSFPCHDVECVRESFLRLMETKPIGWEKIAICIREKASRFNISLLFQESATEEKLIEWYLKKIKKKNEEIEECEGCGED